MQADHAGAWPKQCMATASAGAPPNARRRNACAATRQNAAVAAAAGTSPAPAVGGTILAALPLADAVELQALCEGLVVVGQLPQHSEAVHARRAIWVRTPPAAVDVPTLQPAGTASTAPAAAHKHEKEEEADEALCQAGGWEQQNQAGQAKQKRWGQAGAVAAATASGASGARRGMLLHFHVCAQYNHTHIAPTVSSLCKHLAKQVRSDTGLSSPLLRSLAASIVLGAPSFP